MPLSVPARYRVKTLRSGKKIRLAFAPGSGKVLEVAKLRKGKQARVLKLVPGLSKL